MPKSLRLSKESRTFVGMIELSTHIEYLLLHQTEVSVPQLGTFIVREMSSRRVDEEGIFLPPYRTVSFLWNEQEAGEDFIQSFSRMHNLSRTDARMMCIEYVDELQQALEEDGTVSFGSMGYMLRNAETGELSFMPQQSGIASPAYYGLDAVPFSKLSYEVRQQRAKKLAANKVKLTSFEADKDTITIRINRRAFNYASAVAASIVLFFAITSPFGKAVTSGVSQQAEMFFASKFMPSVKPDPKAVEVQPKNRRSLLFRLLLKTMQLSLQVLSARSVPLTMQLSSKNWVTMHRHAQSARWCASSFQALLQKMKLTRRLINARQTAATSLKHGLFC